MSRRHRNAAKMIRSAERFKNSKIYGTGHDPNGSFIEFLKKDIIKNIDVFRDTFRRKENLILYKDKNAVSPKKKIIKHSETPAVPYTIETDHISFSQPNLKSVTPVYPKFSRNSSTNQGWEAPRAPYTMNNCQSISYNIINFQENPHAVVRKATSVKAARTKGITEFSDLIRPYNPNYNKDYSEAIKENPRMFYKKTGIFSHMYDAAGKVGFMTMPFEKSIDKSGKPPFK